MIGKARKLRRNKILMIILGDFIRVCIILKIDKIVSTAVNRSNRRSITYTQYLIKKLYICKVWYTVYVPAEDASKKSLRLRSGMCYEQAETDDYDTNIGVSLGSSN